MTAEKMAAWRKANPELAKQRDRDFRARHKNDPAYKARRKLEKQRYYAAHREDVLAKSKARHALIGHTAQYKEAKRRYAKAHPLQRTATQLEKHRVRMRLWNRAHPDKLKALNRRQYLKHQQERQSWQAVYRDNNRDAVCASVRRSRKKYPDRIRERNRRRAALQASVAVGRVDYAVIRADANGVCGLCRKPLAESLTHFDHKIPLSKGGSHTQENIHLTHALCNLKKQNKLVEVVYAVL